MKQDTQDKFAAILAAQLANVKKPNFSGKTGAENQQPEKPAEDQKPAAFPYRSATNLQALNQNTVPQAASLPNLADNSPAEPTPAELPEAEKSPLKSFTIVWHEGTGDFDGTTVRTWTQATELLNKIYDQHEGEGYTKVKICVEWENGRKILDRTDVGNNGRDYNPASFGSIGEYLKDAKSVMYESNLQQGDRIYILQMEDSPAILATLEDARKEEAQQAAPELSTMSSADLLGEEIKEGDTVTYLKGTERAEVKGITACTPMPFALLKFENGDIENAYLDALKKVKPTTAGNGLQLVDYSEKALAIFGDTRPHKDQLKAMGGRFNPLLKYAGETKAGWIFSKKHHDTLAQFVRKAA